LAALLDHGDPHVRVWAIRLLTDLDTLGGVAALDGLELGQLSRATVDRLLQRADVESHGLVLTYLASSLRLMSAADRWHLARRLARHGSLAEDRVFPYLVWYGLEPSVAEMAGEIEQWLQDSQLPVVDRFVARRLAIEQTVRSGAVEPLLVALAQPTLSAARRANLLQGLAEGWDGWTDLPVPAAWGAVAAWLSAEGASEEAARGWLERAAASFAAQQSWAERVAVLRDEQRPLELRQATLRSIVRQLNRMDGEEPDPGDETLSREEVASTLRALLQHRFLSGAAANAVAEWREPRGTAWLIEGYGAAPPAGQAAIVSALTQRATSAVELLRGVAAGQIPREAVTAGHLRQLQLLGDAAVATQLQALWPETTGLLAQSQLQKIQALQEELQPESIALGDLMRGRHLYAQQCGKCHRLFGHGERLGPELTGAQRDNLNYWLQNIVAPSAEVSSEYRLTAVLLTDGRTLAGVVTQRTPAAFVLVSQEQSQLVQMGDVEELRPLEQSLMPDGLLDNLSQQDKVDLFAYLMSARGE
jgi:putative heme-binding domain-containing protein